MTKKPFPADSLNPESKDEISQKLNRFADGMAKNRGYFYSEIQAFCFCCLILLPLCSFAQHPLTLNTINQFKNNYSSKAAIEPQTLPIDAYFVRFNELGAIYNPDFPKTRNIIEVKNYQKKEKFIYIGRSLSTFRATVILKGRVGEFYCLMTDGACSSMIEYKVEKKEQHLQVSGTLYRCCQKF